MDCSRLLDPGRKKADAFAPAFSMCPAGGVSADLLVRPAFAQVRQLLRHKEGQFQRL